MEEEGLHYHAKIRIYRKEKNFGPGMASLMLGVEQTGSLSAACKQMGMAYSKAWKLIKQAEEDLGISLMEGSRGGSHGGRTVLTQEGSKLLHTYLEFEAEAQAELNRLFDRYFYPGKS